jgi:serine/threonine protein kinase
MFTDSTRSSIKITDWGLVKILDPIRSREHGEDGVPAAAVDVDRKSLELTAVVGEGNIGGTPDYCSPEQWFASAQKTSESVDGRTDIFSLGIIFYEMLTRRRPKSYDPNNPNLARPPIDVPSWISIQLRQSIVKMIELEPKNRQHSIWDLISEIETAPENSL